MASSCRKTLSSIQINGKTPAPNPNHHADRHRAIHREPALYPDPETYNPERWLSPEYPTFREPLTKYPNLQNFSSFGFGRRICQGQNIAERELHIATARIAWACQIEKAKDADGNVIEVPLYNYTVGFNTQPEPFQYSLKPRSEERMAILKRAVQSAKETDPLG
jgi:Cytochrome P450